MALSGFVRRLLGTALAHNGAGKELADAVDAATVQGAANATISGNKAFTGANTHAGSETFSGGVAVDTTGLTLTDVNLVLTTTTGTKIGTAVGQKLAFHNSTPVVQRAGAAQAILVAITGGESPTEAEHNLVITLVNELRAALIEKGLIKGAA